MMKWEAFWVKQSVLIVDDEKPIVTLLTFHLKQAGFQTDQAYDGQDAVEKAEQNKYDLIILDLMLPKMDGVEVCSYLRSHHIHTPILMLTARDEESDKILGLETGADDYLTKPFSPKEVIARINAILRRVNKPVQSSVSSLKIGDLVIFPERYEAMVKQISITLTRKEFELLYYLALHRGEVISRDQLLREVWNYEFAGDTRIVDVHISHLRDKIEPHDKKTQYIKTVRGLGYKMEDVIR